MAGGDFSAFGAIILAAGLSRRMGGPNKLLQPYRGKPLVEHAFETAMSLGLRDCVSVTGRDAADIAKIAASFGIRAVHNPDYTEGLGASIATGVAGLSFDISGIFIVLGDMPHIKHADYTLLTQAFAPGQITMPSHDGMRGHPVLFCASYRYELARLGGDEGARSIIKNHHDRIVEVIVNHSGVLTDLDQPDDFKKQ